LSGVAERFPFPGDARPDAETLSAAIESLEQARESDAIATRALTNAAVAAFDR
jgi:hypothetical protein